MVPREIFPPPPSPWKKSLIKDWVLGITPRKCYLWDVAMNRNSFFLVIQNVFKNRRFMFFNDFCKSTKNMFFRYNDGVPTEQNTDTITEN